jgi:hypothetical protein
VLAACKNLANLQAVKSQREETMTSTIQLPFAAVITNFTEAFTGMLDEATQITRESTEAYLKGLDTIVEQQKLACESSRQWMSEIVTVQSHLGEKIIRSYTSDTDWLAEASATSAEVTEGAVAKIARGATSKSAPAKRRQTTTPRRAPRRPTTPAATAALASAVGAGLTNWTSEGYDSLTAAEVIEKLPGFSQRDLREVDTYEKTHQARQTVLQRIESLHQPEPVAGYDELTVPDVQQQLTAGDEARATSVRDYERSHKKRDGVLHAAQARIDQG